MKRLCIAVAFLAVAAAAQFPPAPAGVQPGLTGPQASGAGSVSASSTLTNGDAVCATGSTTVANCGSTFGVLVGSVQIAVTGNSTALGVATNTGSVTGAATTDVVTCSAAGTADADVGIAQAYVSGSNTVTLAIRTFVTDASAPSITYNCRVWQ